MDIDSAYAQTLIRRCFFVLLESAGPKNVSDIDKALRRRYSAEGRYEHDQIREALKHPPAGVTVKMDHAYYTATGSLPAAVAPEAMPVLSQLPLWRTR